MYFKIHINIIHTYIQNQHYTHTPHPESLSNTYTNYILANLCPCKEPLLPRTSSCNRSSCCFSSCNFSSPSTMPSGDLRNSILFVYTHTSRTVSTHIFQVQFQHTHFRCSFNAHISIAVSTHTFQVQFQHTYFKYSFNTHISSTVSTHIFQVQFQHTYFSTHTHTKVQNACQALSPWHHKFST